MNYCLWLVGVLLVYTPPQLKRACQLSGFPQALLLLCGCYVRHQHLRELAIALNLILNRTAGVAVSSYVSIFSYNLLDNFFLTAHSINSQVLLILVNFSNRPIWRPACGGSAIAIFSSRDRRVPP